MLRARLFLARGGGLALAFALATARAQTITPTPTVTPTATVSPTVTPSPGGSATPTPSVVPTPSATPRTSVTPTPSATPKPSAAASATVSPTATPITSAFSVVNLSTRGLVQTGNSVLIGGLIIEGAGTKTLLLRGLGPSLATAGVTDALANPALTLYDANGAELAANDDWTTGSQMAQIMATGLAPSNSLESALIVSLAPGNYTAAVNGVNGTAGVGLVEIYDLDTAPTAILQNISTRGQVGTGTDVLIGGFIIGGSSPVKVLLRALGPSLSSSGVTGTLADPNLDLHGSTGSIIVSNNNWMDSQAADITATGLAPADASESAILATLQPGSYTGVVTGVGNTTGVGLFELYNLGAQ